MAATYTPMLILVVNPVQPVPNIAATQVEGFEASRINSHLIPAQQKERILPDKFTNVAVFPVYSRQ